MSLPVRLTVTYQNAGHQCMASCFFLLKQFEDVLVYKPEPYSAHTWDCYCLYHGRYTLLVYLKSRQAVPCH